MLSSGAIGIVMRRKLYKIQKPKLTRTLTGPCTVFTCDLESFHLFLLSRTSMSFHLLFFCPPSFSTSINVFWIQLPTTWRTTSRFAMAFLGLSAAH